MASISKLPIELLYQIFAEGCYDETTDEIMLQDLSPLTRQRKEFVKPLRLVSRVWRSMIDNPGNSESFWCARVVLSIDVNHPPKVVMARQLSMLQHILRTSDNCEIYLILQCYMLGPSVDGTYEQLPRHDQITIKLFIYGMSFLNAYWKQFAFIRVDSNQPQICHHFLFCFLRQTTLPNLISISFDFNTVLPIKGVRDAIYFPGFNPLCGGPNTELGHISRTLGPLTSATRLFLPHQGWMADFKLPNQLHKLEIRTFFSSTRDEIDFSRSLSSLQVLRNLKYLKIRTREFPREDGDEGSEHGFTRAPTQSLYFPYLRKLELVVRNTSDSFASLWARWFLKALDCPVLNEILYDSTLCRPETPPRPCNPNDQYDLTFPALKFLTISSCMLWGDLHLLSHFGRSTTLQHLTISQYLFDPTPLPEKSPRLVDVLSGCQFQLRSIKVVPDLMETITIFESLDVSLLQSIELRLPWLSRSSSTFQITAPKVKLEMPALTNIELQAFTITEAASFFSGISAGRLETLSFQRPSPGGTVSLEADLSSDSDILNDRHPFGHLRKLNLGLFGHELAPTFKLLKNLACNVQYLDYRYDTRLTKGDDEQTSLLQPDGIKRRFDEIFSLYCIMLEPVKGEAPFPLVRNFTGTFCIVEGQYPDIKYIGESIQNFLDHRALVGALPLKLDVLEIKPNHYLGSSVYIEANERTPHPLNLLPFSVSLPTIEYGLQKSANDIE